MVAETAHRGELQYGRSQTSDPPSLLIDREERLGTRHRGEQCRGLLRGLDVPLEQDDARELTRGQGGPEPLGRLGPRKTGDQDLTGAGESGSCVHDAVVSPPKPESAILDMP